MGETNSPPPIPFPQRQKSVPDRMERDQASDPRFNVALEASAGTGKTSVLVSRYVRLVELGASPRHVLAITFTRKAAGEMRARILSELRARPLLWKDLRDRLYEIHVTTIDAFCLGLLREFPLEAGLDPDIELLDEVDSHRLSEKVIEETLAEAKSATSPDYAFLVDSFGEGGLRRGIKDFLQSRLVRESQLEHYVEKILPRAITLRQSLARVTGSLSALFGSEDGLEKFIATGPVTAPEKPESPGFQAFAFALRRGIDPDRISAYDIEEIARYFLTAKLEPRRKLGSLAPKSLFEDPRHYDSHRDQVLALAPRVREIYLSWFEDKDRIAVRALARLYKSAAEKFGAAKSRRARLDFTDVLRNAVQLLEQRGEFAQSRFRLESRYHHLLVDEFQDTNEMQWRLVRALIESWGEGAGLVQDAISSEQSRAARERLGTEPSARTLGEQNESGDETRWDPTARIEEPSIFIVGDRKQSIYGFRDARVEVMERASRQILRIRPKGAHRLKIRKSFRATPTLARFINDLFSEMPKVTSELAYAFQFQQLDQFPIDPDSAEPTAPDFQVETLALAMGSDRSTVADAIATEILRLVEHKHAALRDIAILFRSRTHYRIYEKALNKKGIPTHVYRGLGFFDATEVRDIQALIRYLAEPTSELRAAELARSRIVGITDTGLYRLAHAGRREVRPIVQWLAGRAPSPDVSLSEEDRERMSWAARAVPQWVSESDRVPAAEQIQQILGQVDYAGWFQDEEQGWENLKKTMELIRRAQNRGYLTMARLVEFLERASLSDESLAVIEAAEAVNLMTIHASKGLEFDTVFLVNMEQATGADRSLPRVTERPNGTYEIHALTPADTNENEPSRALEEEKRLLYVAATRAKRRLVLSATLDDSPADAASLFGLMPKALQRAILNAYGKDPVATSLEWTATGEHPRHLLRWLRSTEGDEKHGAAESPRLPRLEDQEPAREALRLGPPNPTRPPTEREDARTEPGDKDSGLSEPEGSPDEEQMKLF